MIRSIGDFLEHGARWAISYFEERKDNGYVSWKPVDALTVFFEVLKRCNEDVEARAALFVLLEIAASGTMRRQEVKHLLHDTLLDFTGRTPVHAEMFEHLNPDP